MGVKSLEVDGPPAKNECRRNSEIWKGKSPHPGGVACEVSSTSGAKQMKGRGDKMGDKRTMASRRVGIDGL